MNKFILNTLILFLLDSISECYSNNLDKEYIQLNNNTFLLRDSVNKKSISYIIKNIVNINEKDIYLYIDSPGGDVLAGYNLINVIEYYSEIKNIYCIADHASSMAFTIFQSCPNRYILENSQLMQHRMVLTLSDTINTIKNKLIMYEKLENELIDKQINRIGISYKDYLEKTKDEWIIFGKNAIIENMADKVITIGYNKNIGLYENIRYENSQLKEINPRTLRIKEIISKCPLIKLPIDTEYKYL